MPAWLLPLLIKFVLPFILRELVKSGMISEAKAIAIKYGIDFEQFLANLKTYQEYPTGKNGQSAENSPPATTSFTVGEKLEPKP